RIMAEDGTLGFAQIGMGVTPGWGGAERLYDLVGYAQAIDLLLSGRVIGGAEARRIGLANRLSPPGEALNTALAIAGRLASGPRLAVR
ncbi:MAG: enoyl-CoA hydratase/isomerase family protein, partial [Gammaproteobacteria bacterium]|nr:enoyl-CoA hydratase/isomerase family protein [Gammaproteobacteria bacterium]